MYTPYKLHICTETQNINYYFLCKLLERSNKSAKIGLPQNHWYYHMNQGIPFLAPCDPHQNEHQCIKLDAVLRISM